MVALKQDLKKVHTYVWLCLLSGSAGKESACNAGDLGLIPGLGRSPREGKGFPPQYSSLENSMNCIDHGVSKSQTQLSNFHFTLFYSLDETQAGTKTARGNTNNPSYSDDTTLLVEREEELKSFLMKVKEESEKPSLKLNIQKVKIMASGPITSWQIDGDTMETVRHFIFLGSKITTHGGCSHEIKRHLLLGRKTMISLGSILKSRELLGRQRSVCLAKAVVFPVVMCRCESWTIRRLSVEEWCFWTVVLEKTLESPLDCKEIKPVNPKGN